MTAPRLNLQIGIRLDDESARRLTRYAQACGCTVTAAARALLIAALHEHAPPVAPAPEQATAS